MILGIYHPAWGAGHDSAVALLGPDGKVIAAHSEERFSRIKMDGGYPFRAYEALQKIHPFKPSDLEAVALPYWGQGDRLMETARITAACRDLRFARNWWHFRTQDPFQKEMAELGAYDYLKNYLESISRVQKADNRPPVRGWKEFLEACGLSNVPCVRVDHHVAHAAGAYYTSGWEHALIITADGVGAQKSSLVAVGEKGRLRVIARTFLPDSPGRFWEAITHLCGFNHHKHGGKITGLAAFGNAEAPCYEIMKACLWQKGLTAGSDIRPKHMAESLRGVPREDIAATAQRRLEEVLCGMVREAVRVTGIRRVAAAGGVFANVLLNQKIYELPEVDDFYIYPAMGDEGLAAGAALWAHARRRHLNPYRFDHLYLGAGYDPADVETALSRHGLRAKKMDEETLVEKIAGDLCEKKVVAHFQGRMEFGPRALGHRSILYSTEDADVNRWLNERLNRSEFMPFAPVTLAEEAGECYENIPNEHYPARFMTMTYRCTPRMKKQSPAVVHKDGTARPQLIREADGRYYRILKTYFAKTGIPSLVNTSYNMHEEPIVGTPEDAVRAFLDGRLDVLILDNYRIEAERK